MYHIAGSGSISNPEIQKASAFLDESPLVPCESFFANKITMKLAIEAHTILVFVKKKKNDAEYRT